MTTMLTIPAAVAPLGAMLAYIGPGLGFGAIAAILGIVFSVFLAIFAAIWYPMKRLFGIGKKPRTQPPATQVTREKAASGEGT